MESRWAELRLILPRRRFDLTSAHLFELGTVGIQEDLLPGELPRIQQPWDTGPPPAPPSRVLLRAWWPEDTALPEVQAAVAELIREWDDVDVPTWGEVADGDWAEAWRAAFHPIRVSERLVVSPPWEAGPGDLLIEPGMAFGTGEHPTTRACLAAVDRLAVPGETCVDLGMGTGVLALAAARVGMKARGVDIDPDSVRAARENAARNQLEAYFDDTPVEALVGPFDLVVANLFAEVLIHLAPHILRLVGGSLVMAGILSDRAARVEAAFSSLRLVRREVDSTGDWVCLEYRR